MGASCLLTFPNGRKMTISVFNYPYLGPKVSNNKHQKSPPCQRFPTWFQHAVRVQRVEEDLLVLPSPADLHLPLPLPAPSHPARGSAEAVPNTLPPNSSALRKQPPFVLPAAMSTLFPLALKALTPMLGIHLLLLVAKEVPSSSLLLAAERGSPKLFNHLLPSVATFPQAPARPWSPQSTVPCLLSRERQLYPALQASLCHHNHQTAQ